MQSHYLFRIRTIIHDQEEQGTQSLTLSEVIYSFLPTSLLEMSYLNLPTLNKRARYEEIKHSRWKLKEFGQLEKKEKPMWLYLRNDYIRWKSGTIRVSQKGDAGFCVKHTKHYAVFGITFSFLISSASRLTGGSMAKRAKICNK